MNHLQQRKGPELLFVTEAYKNIFEQNVVQYYVDQLIQAPSNIVPALDEMNVFMDFCNMNNHEVYVAALLARRHDDEYAINEALDLLTEREKYIFLKNTYEDALLTGTDFYDDLYLEDVESVLNFHHITHMVNYSIDDKGFLERGVTYRNMPSQKVW